MMLASSCFHSLRTWAFLRCPHRAFVLRKEEALALLHLLNGHLTVLDILKHELARETEVAVEWALWERVYDLLVQPL